MTQYAAQKTVTDQTLISLSQLDARYQQVALSALNLSNAERQEINTKLQGLAAGSLISGQQMQELLMDTNLDAATKRLILSKTGLTDAIGINTIAAKANVIEKLKILAAEEKWNAEIVEGIIGKMADTAATNTMAGANMGLAASFKTLMASIPVWGWIALAISAVISVLQTVIPMIKSSSEQLEETAQALADIRSERESLNDELKTTAERIAELEAKGTLSFTDEAELNRLNKENAALKTKIELLDIEAKKTREQNRNNFNELIDEEETETSNKSWEKTEWHGNNDVYADVTDKDRLLELAKAYDEATKSGKDYIDVKGKAHSIEDIENEITAFSDNIQEYQSYLDDLYQDGFDYNTADEKTKQNIDFANEMIDRYMVLVGKTNTVWERAYNSDRFSAARTSIEELANAGNLSAESLQNLYNQGGNVKEFIDYMLSLNTVDWKTMLGDKFTDVAGEDGIVSLDEALTAMAGDTEIASKIMGLFANELNTVEEAAKGVANSVLTLSQSYEKLTEKVDPLAKAYEEMTEFGELPADTLFNLLNSHKDLIKYIEIENGKYKIRKSLLKDEFELQRQLLIDQLKKSHLNTFLNTPNPYESQMGPFPYSFDLIKKNMEELERMSKEIEILQNLDIDDLLNGSKKSPVEKQKEAAEKYFAELKYQLETNKITQEEYLKTLDKKYKKFYNKTADYLEDYAKYSQEVYDGFKDMYKEDLEAQKEAWEEKKDAVSEYYDKLREEIENTHDEEDYEKEQSEKRKEIFDLDMQIAELMRDGSEKAKARIAELEEERLKAEEELLDFETDKAREDELSRLEKEQKAEEDKIQDEIDKIDDDLKSIDENITKARQDIINYARAKGVTLDFAYASGTKSSVGGFGRINEKGIEMISAPDGNGSYVNLMPSSYVFSAKATEFLWKLATEHSLPQAMYNSIAKSIKTQSSTPSVNIAQPITITMGDIIIKGNADKQTVADIKKQQENTVRMVLQKIKELQK